MQGIETGAEGSVLKYVAKALPENLHTFSDNTIRMYDGLKCSTLWSNVRLLEMFDGWKRIIEKRMRGKPSVPRKLSPFCPLI